MAREVTSVNQFDESPKFGLDKTVTVVRCDDGYIYELEETDSSQGPRLRRGIDTVAKEYSHLRGAKILPSAVEETLDALVAGWHK